VFLVAALIAIVGVLIVTGLRERPLRTRAQPGQPAGDRGQSADRARVAA
jgi:hypothetical protein